jgi:hypothetical protein
VEGHLSRAALLADYAALLTHGFCSPEWVSGKIELNAEETAWIEALEHEAAQDELRITHTWESHFGGWALIATIAAPRHDREYGLPKPRTNPDWRHRFEREWGQQLMIARRRVAAERAAQT